MKIIEVSKCSCGALTVYFENDTNNSMQPETFKKLFNKQPQAKSKLYQCNHCVNRWGLDLCGCGSGETVGKCSNDFYECRNNEPSQQFAENKPFVGWK